jgi:hypothetical protein
LTNTLTKYHHDDDDDDDDECREEKSLLYENGNEIQMIFWLS